ncbi:hypothetical protein evm_015141, partial [Chilo suppressalis]
GRRMTPELGDERGDGGGYRPRPTRNARPNRSSERGERRGGGAGGGGGEDRRVPLENGRPHPPRAHLPAHPHPPRPRAPFQPLTKSRREDVDKR